MSICTGVCPDGGRETRGAGRLEPRLGLGDVDLDAVRALRGRVLPEGGRPLGRQEPPPGLLALSVGQVQGLLPRDRELPFGGLLWYWRGDLSFILKSTTGQNWGESEGSPQAQTWSEQGPRPHAARTPLSTVGPARPRWPGLQRGTYFL